VGGRHDFVGERKEKRKGDPERLSSQLSRSEGGGEEKRKKKGEPSCLSRDGGKKKKGDLSIPIAAWRRGGGKRRGIFLFKKDRGVGASFFLEGRRKRRWGISPKRDFTFSGPKQRVRKGRRLHLLRVRFEKGEGVLVSKPEGEKITRAKERLPAFACYFANHGGGKEEKGNLSATCAGRRKIASFCSGEKGRGSLSWGMERTAEHCAGEERGGKRRWAVLPFG